MQLELYVKPNPEYLQLQEKGSPLVVGIGHGENFIASDQLALLISLRNSFSLRKGIWLKLHHQELNFGT